MTLQLADETSNIETPISLRALCRTIRGTHPRSARNLDYVTLYYVYRG